MVRPCSQCGSARQVTGASAALRFEHAPRDTDLEPPRHENSTDGAASQCQPTVPPRRGQSKIPKFVGTCGTFGYELRNLRTPRCSFEPEVRGRTYRTMWANSVRGAGSERPTRRSPPGGILAAFGHWDQAFALRLLPGGLPRASDRFRFLAGLALGRLFIGLTTLHLAKHALALHLLLEGPESLLDIVVANEYLQMFSNRDAGAVTGAAEVLGNRSRQRTLRLSADSLPRLLTTSNSTVCPSLREVRPARSTAEIWRTTLLPP